jgi:hypothetical protein
MRRKSHSEEKILYALRQVEAGKKAGDISLIERIAHYTAAHTAVWGREFQRPHRGSTGFCQPT